MKGYHVKNVVVKKPKDLGFPERWDGYVLCNDNDTIKDGLLKKFGISEIYKIGEAIEKPADTVPVSELTVGEIGIVMREALKALEKSQ